MECAEAQRRLATLTARERDVMDLIVKGLTNKEAARALGTSHRTVDVHRTNLMRKMDAPSLADLVRTSLLAEGREAG
jgi:FixJ family two-component response regulator